MGLKLGSLFDGIGSFPLAATMHGIEPVWASEIEKFPIAVTSKHFPQMKHLGDITKINGAKIEPVDIITAGSPCFPQGTLVLTTSGYKPIEEIQPGERVLSHTGQWRKVLRAGSTLSDTILLKGFGHYGIETTPEHPFYASEKKRKYYACPVGKKRPNPTVYMTTPQWTQAAELKGKFWATPLQVEQLPIVSVQKLLPDRLHRKIQMDNDFWWFVGYWLGNGWVRNGQRSKRPEGQMRGQFFIAAPYTKADTVKERLDKIGLRWLRIKERTVVKFRTNHKELVQWMLENFGCYAHGKRLPAWCLGMDVEPLSHLFKGYLDADGSVMKCGGFSITSVSKQLAMGMRLVAERLGYATSFSFNKRPPQHIIEGRVVNQRDTYVLHVRPEKKGNSRIVAHGFSWGLVRSATPCGQNKRVYNLEVETDNSYVVENIIVHNCQDLSIAGKRVGLEGSQSSLFLHFIRIVREMRHATDNRFPRYILWENVLGAFSSNGGQDFRTVLEEIAEAKIPMPKSGKWATAGMVRGAGRSLAWRVLDAQHYGVPQRRKRIFLVCDFAGGSSPEILLEPQGMSGNPAESGEKGEETAANAGDGIKATCGCLTPWDCQSKRIFDPQGVYPTLQAMNGGGANNTAVLLPVSPTVSAKWAKGTGGPSGDERQNLVVAPFNTGQITSPQNGNKVEFGLPCHTLSANEHPPSVIIATKELGKTSGAIAFNGDQSAKTRSMGESFEQSPTLRSGGPVHVAYQRETLHLQAFGPGGQHDIAHALRAQPSKADKPSSTTYVLQNNMIGRQDKNGPQGNGINEDVSFMLNATDRHAVAYGICSLSSNSMKSPNPHSGIYEAETSRTLDLNGGNPACNQGGIMIIENTLYENHGQDSRITGPLDVAPTVHQKYGTGGNNTPLVARAFTSSQFGQYQEGCGTLRASGGDYGGGSENLTVQNYTVRRLTVVECLRLMGFPSSWFDGVPGYSDTAGYKACGNSAVVPCVEWIMGRIEEATQC